MFALPIIILIINWIALYLGMKSADKLTTRVAVGGLLVGAGLFIFTIFQVDWDNFGESGTLQPKVEETR